MHATISLDIECLVALVNAYTNTLDDYFAAKSLSRPFLFISYLMLLYHLHVPLCLLILFITFAGLTLMGYRARATIYKYYYNARACLHQYQPTIAHQLSIAHARPPLA